MLGLNYTIVSNIVNKLTILLQCKILFCHCYNVKFGFGIAQWLSLLFIVIVHCHFKVKM